MANVSTETSFIFSVVIFLGFISFMYLAASNWLGTPIITGSINFSSVGSMVNSPNIYITMLLAVPLSITVTYIILRLLRGGG
jgi:hypothetical protein